jgi:hypothetical protein
MKFNKLFIILFSLFICNVANAQNIIKIVKKFVLINNVNESSGLVIGDRIPVFRTMKSGSVSKIGQVQIVKFVQGRCAAKIVSENGSGQIAVGDYINLPARSSKIRNSEKASASISSEPGDVGIEKGDSELLFAGFYMKMLSEYFDMSTAFIQVSYAKFLTSRFQVGVAPQFMLSKASGVTNSQFSASAFFNYNLATASKVIPYISGSWYQSDFAPEYLDFIDYSYVEVGAGIRNFFNQYAALNTSISYGFPLSSNGEGGILTITSGLSFIF